MVNAIKLSENEANEIIAKYLRTISIKLLDYMSLLKLSLKSEGHNVDMIKQVSEKNENNEYEPIYICYVDLLKRGR